MKFKRLWWSIHTCFIRGSKKRADYARRKHIYHHVGENVCIQPRSIPLYSELISFGDNVVVARNVDFCTHDVIHAVLNKLPARNNGNDYHFKERIGCIQVCDNVFIGSNSVILYGVKIQPNVIIASGSVVVKDCESNSVYAGVPAKKIGTLGDYISKRVAKENEGKWTTTRHNQALTSEEIEAAWASFEEAH